MRREYIQKLKRTAKSYGLRELARKTTLSRQSLYNLFQRHDFKMSTLESIAENLEYDLVIQIEAKVELDKKILYSGFRKLGAPFFENEQVGILPEDILLKGLECSVSNPKIADALPYVLSKNSEALDFFLLLNNLKTEKDRQLLGYFSELANKLYPSDKLKTILKLLYRNDFPLLSLLSQKKPGKFTLQLLENVQKPSAEKWHILTLSAESELLERYRKWKRLDTQDSNS